jgi:hypothetical protein
MNSESLLSPLVPKSPGDLVVVEAVVSSTASEPVEFINPKESAESRIARDPVEYSLICSRKREFLPAFTSVLEHLCLSESVGVLPIP